MQLQHTQFDIILMLVCDYTHVPPLCSPPVFQTGLSCSDCYYNRLSHSYDSISGLSVGPHTRASSPSLLSVVSIFRHKSHLFSMQYKVWSIYFLGLLNKCKLLAAFNSISLDHYIDEVFLYDFCFYT